MKDDVNRDLVIVSERVFETDRATLFGAFADATLLARWWGPHDFTNRIDEFDFQTGGTWRITMTSSAGMDFANRWTFEDIRPGERIRAFHHEPMHAFGLDMHYADCDGGTRLTWHMSFEDTEQNRDIEKFLAAANQQNFDRLEDLLAEIEALR
ncbi:SRPBCC domain-containing protein [Neorhizobium sp. NCHU2750]|uniref:SRPBCC domain-containing protein n=1 Tax=Neorhizobium sp. NCHU2750 TaxID=1825976 RepID=UPI000E715D59|nr:ATPase [Neorhizobium sp. NCHU2750]